MQKWLNGALLAAGGVFCLTALLYVVMMVRADRATRNPTEKVANTDLDRLISQYGQTALITELCVLGVLTAVVILRDDRPRGK